MFRSGPNYQKLKTNLRISIHRLKLLEKKKSELALKARKEIADYIQAGKDDRARIRVEHIVREDYLVEGMEILELFCDLVLARFGLIEKMKDMDPGLEEAISSILWASIRLQGDIPEFKEIAKQFTHKYGPEFREQCIANDSERVNEKLAHKLSIHSPPRSLIENYMVEIAKTYNVPFEPDQSALCEEGPGPVDGCLIDFDGKGPGMPPSPPGNFPGGASGGSGGGGNAAPSPFNPPSINDKAYPPSNYVTPPNQPYYNPAAYPPNGPNQPNMPVSGGLPPPLPDLPPAASLPIKPAGGCDMPPHHSAPPEDMPSLPSYDAAIRGGPQSHQNPPRYKGQPPSGQNFRGPPNASAPPGSPLPPPPSSNGQNIPPPENPSGGQNLSFPDLPAVPNITPGNSTLDASAGGDDVDFDDLTRRFEELKKKK